MLGHKVNMNTPKPVFFVIANSGEVPGTGIQIFEREKKKLPTFCHILFMVVPFDFICFECFSSDNILAEC